MQGLDLNVRSSKGWTPLHIALRKGQAAMVRLLLSFEASINLATHNHHTVLHIAAQHGPSDVMQQLLTAAKRPLQQNIRICTFANS
jgi:ankyrin repeat protein